MRCLIFRNLLAAACLVLAVAGAMAFTPPADMLAVQELCDNADLRPIEGIWTYPEDVSVLIYRSEEKKGTYSIYISEAADCDLKPGMKLGELRESAEPDKYNLSQFTSIKRGILSVPATAVSTYSENKESLTVRKNGKFRLRINPTRLLPSFWRIANVTVKSGGHAPEGLIKIYPSYDGNGSTRRAPRYL